MKTALIAILSLLLVLAAFLTRPGQREFVLYLLDSQAPDGNIANADFSRAQAVLKDVKFNDHWLWVDVEHNGKIIYTGVFSHFVPHSFDSQQSLPNVEQLAKLMGKVDEMKK